MNVVERDIAAPESERVSAAAEVPVAPPSKRPRARNLRPLVSLFPYVARYRFHAIAALVALLAAAIATLVVPIAIRRMIDFGFSRDSVNLIDNYFSVMLGVVAVLAVASAMRFYLVTTLGERIVADLREEVFGHLVSLSPA
jgi:ATP-binding cassette subfamily B protein